MFSGASSEESNLYSKENYLYGYSEKVSGEIDWYGHYGELEIDEPEVPDIKECVTCISEGDFLPYGPRLYLENNRLVRIKDIGERRRILLVGVIGSYTPYCWNRHLFRVLNKSRYYEERGIDFICCVSTNDAATQTAWGVHLGCTENVFMLADPSKKFTKSMGMDIVIPWLDSNIRSRRYVIFAENMEVMKMIVATEDGPQMNLECEHLITQDFRTDDDDDDDDDESDLDFYL